MLRRSLQNQYVHFGEFNDKENDDQIFSPTVTVLLRDSEGSMSYYCLQITCHRLLLNNVDQSRKINLQFGFS